MIWRPNKTKGACAPFSALCLLALATATSAQGNAVTNLPTPGSYSLHRIQKMPDARLLDANGAPTSIAARTRGAVTALGFFYGHCQDPSGCPVAWSVFETVRQEALSDPLLARSLRLVFVSLDPARDTPAAMRLLETAENGGDDEVPWTFLTSDSEQELIPFLGAMGQDIGYVVDDAGRRAGAIQHMLKVFLIDPEGWVREIYSTAFLSPESLLNDARTVAMAFPETDSRAGRR